jgi:AraC-like DNA-binding protein/quercetin dioxygenase-like cupin family protein
MRQDEIPHEILHEYDPPEGVWVSALAWEYPAGTQVPEHAHGSDQLIYAITGIMEVTSGQSVWVIPPEFALWIPAMTSHRIQMDGMVKMRTLYFKPGVVTQGPPHGSVLHVNALVREVVLEAVRLERLCMDVPYECAIRDVLVHQLERATPAPTFVTMPVDPRARSVAQAILSSRSESVTLADLCAEAGVSVRTVQRIFKSEVGIDLDSWRRQARLTKAMQLLMSGVSVKEVSYAVGYGQPSAFVQAFRRLFGATPKAWAANLRAGHNSN